ncbi:response regulator [Salipiger marinus]|jgi:DNA-binding NarL/FixJ family response regulator|uniref:Two component transcriptional regulator, LuxR family n=1 Tax=Salipiger marinus TaxID=555512 RepID=A0A1G8J262_9RHOB|nr:MULTISPECIES: response regulator transcription factor [Salipiger]HBM61764.1 DNA-binding response regulator [Citreicella sp.]MCD1618445.1 response regulator transcription factor [Salipiger manganoxidans]MEB3417958.1 response regulator transcription factor [Salipiger manganoxidans]SDI25388.1 two component transcriptional regulator, LuxR family [Salipiger marinus]HBS98643.1 DNA-binding response regulator [Citreicella sp.]|tara:strand:+ start:117 stop:842 length:726 start_codon:yes stop_codon:yes gene_type:complete
MRVLLVEDDPFHATFLQDVLAEALPEVTETLHATDGAAGEAEARATRIEAVVMDLQMDRRNGIEAARAIWAERPRTRILFWSNYSDEAYLRGISRIVPEDSAYGYVLKTATRERLKLALRAVLVEGQIMVDREIHRLQRRTGSPRQALDDSEYAVLLDLALGLQDKLIAERRGMSLRTVQNRLLSLYDKLGVEGEDEGPALNKRVRALSRAFSTRTLNVETLEGAQREYDRWLVRRARGAA